MMKTLFVSFLFLVAANSNVFAQSDGEKSPSIAADQAAFFDQFENLDSLNHHFFWRTRSEHLQRCAS